MTTFKIVRMTADENHPERHKVVKRGLTLEEAQAHCQDPDTRGGDYDEGTAWFDAYTEDHDAGLGSKVTR